MHHSIFTPHAFLPLSKCLDPCMSQAMIEAGAAGVHFEDQLSSEKKCGHLGGACLPKQP